MKLQNKVDKIKKIKRGNDLKAELTSLLYPAKVVQVYYCEIWSTKSTSGGQGNKAGTYYLKNGVVVDKPRSNKKVIDFMMIPELRKEFKKLNIII